MIELQTGFFRRRRIRHVRQVELTECGHTSLAMIANFYGMDFDSGALRRRFPTSQRGATLRGIIGMADQLGMASRAVQLPLEALPGLRLPAILHWSMKHFVVIEAVRHGKALIH